MPMRINDRMIDTPMKIIRLAVLDISQGQMAKIANTTQATVSRWEAGVLEPDRLQMEAIRAAALERGIDWQDNWFFDAKNIPAQKIEAA